MGGNRWRSNVICMSVVACIAAAGPLVATTAATAATPIQVTTTADAVDGADGVVSLREAVSVANAQSGHDTIVLAAGATYTLSICGDEPDNAAGGIDSTDPAGISLEGNGSTVIQTCTGPGAEGFTFAGTGTQPSAGSSLHQVAVHAAQIGVVLRAPAVAGATFQLIDSTIYDARTDCIDASGGMLAWAVSLSHSTLERCAHQAVRSASGTVSLDMKGFSLITDVHNTANAATGIGDFATVDVVDSSISDNDGGGGLVARSAAHFTRARVDSNRGAAGAVAAKSTLTAIGSSFDHNIATTGAAGLEATSLLLLQDVSVSWNQGPVGAVAVRGLASDPVQASLTNVTVDANSSTATGAFPDGVAGIFVTSGAPTGSTVSITGSTIDGNHGTSVSALSADVPVSIQASTIDDNIVTGGQPYPNGGTVAVPSPLTVDRSTIAGNLVPALGRAGDPLAGAIRTSSPLAISTSTISGNSGDVGGLVAPQGVTMSSTTLVDNVGTVADAAALGSENVVGHSVVARTPALPPGSVPACALGSGTTVVSDGFNFESADTCGFHGAGDQPGAGDPLLGPLKVAGGSRPFRQALAGSPLVDRIPAGPACIGTDELGTAVPQGPACDIGAIEGSAGARYHALAPYRILDSRGAVGGWNTTPLGSAPRALTVTGGDVPGSASAVVMNVTATGSTADSFLTVWPNGAPGANGDARPEASNLNFAAGETIANLVTVKVGAGGQVLLASAAGSTDVVADIVGWFDDGATTGTTYHGVAPARVLDSRSTTGPWGATELVAGSPRDVVVANHGGVPVNADSVIVNVTATNASAASFLTVFPSGSATPVVSNLNFAAGQTIPNLVVVKLGTGGAIRLANAIGSTDVVVDVFGYFDFFGGSTFHPVSPMRFLDDRIGLGATGPWGPAQDRLVDVPANGTTGIVMNLTATNPTHNSVVSVRPSTVPLVAVSNLNFATGQTIPNLVMVPTPLPRIGLRNQAGTVDLVADLVGYYTLP